MEAEYYQQRLYHTSLCLSWIYLPQNCLLCQQEPTVRSHTYSCQHSLSHWPVPTVSHSPLPARLHRDLPEGLPPTEPLPHSSPFQDNNNYTRSWRRHATCNQLLLGVTCQGVLNGRTETHTYSTHSTYEWQVGQQSLPRTTCGNIDGKWDRIFSFLQVCLPLTSSSLSSKL